MFFGIWLRRPKILHLYLPCLLLLPQDVYKRQRVQKSMPPAGYTSILSVTDKQYSEIRNYWGKSERARPEMPQQLEFF